MTHLLDTNVCIEHLRAKGQGPVARRFSAVPPTLVGLPSIVGFEVLAGAYRSQDVQKSLHEVQAFLRLFPTLPFDDRCADASAKVFAALAATGTGIGNFDLLIAGTALAHGLILVTHNLNEFQRVPGLAIEDWQSA